MDVKTLNHQSHRAAKARLGYALRGWKSRGLLVLAAVFVLGGVGLLVTRASIGWFVVGLAALPYMLHRWYEGELHHIPSGPNNQVDDLMSSDILGQLSNNPSPRDVAMAAMRVTSGQFMAARFGITSGLLSEIASPSPADTEQLWQHAEAIRQATGVPHYTGSVLAVATLRQFAQYEQLIAQIHLDDADLLAGVRWQQHLRDLIVQHHMPRRTGGIARDWSFGYIPNLTHFGQNISRQMQGGGPLSVESLSHIEALSQLIDTFGSGGRQNAVLVGQPGSGKTTLIHAFASQLLDAEAHLPSSLKFRQVFVLDSSALIAAAPGRGQLENLIMTVLGEAYSAKNIIVCLDNAQLFFEEGIGSVDLTNVLQPILEAGNLRVILSMDEQRYLQIGQRNPGLINALNRIVVAPAEQDETMTIMQEQLISEEFRRRVTYTYQALKEAYRLSERYVHDLAQPGRAIKLLESAASFAENGLVTMNSVQMAIEKTMDVKVSVANTAEDRQRLLNMEELIHERMINQVRAVSVVSDALRRARAGVRNENRPIGTFLFLGPTGVGKTELSKALADVYFGGEGKMIRLDLNEYVRPEDVTRLIADGADDPTSLTAQVMKQPFSVVLLDEIEKAAPEVLATLLQLLDEGILRDIKNREVSFRDAIVIATSNAGADRIREYIERGYDVSQFEAQFVDELINSNQFRPEFLNRFDEIVTFTPLSKQDLLQVVDLILQGVNRTLEPQKVQVNVEPEAQALLVEHGYDPRLGARPMRRVVQKAVENTVAREMLAGNLSAGGTITITAEQVSAILGSAAAASTIASSQGPAQVSDGL